MNDNNFIWLISWYKDHYDGNWEHGKGIHIDSIDNPGWSLSINLEETELENKKFETIEIERFEDNWLFCFVENYRFEGRCGPLNLPEMFQIFREWAEK